MKQARIFQTQTAMIRLVVRIDQYSKENFKGEVVSSNVFPLGFTHCVDAKDHHYEMIKEEVKQNPRRLFQDLMIVEPGLYEFVGEYRGRAEIDKDGKYLECIWQVFNPHLYQLTEEDQKEFGVA